MLGNHLQYVARPFISQIQVVRKVGFFEQHIEGDFLAGSSLKMELLFFSGGQLNLTTYFPR